MVPTREDRGAQHTTWTDARMNAQVGGQHAVWGDAQASPVVPGPSGVSAAGVGGYEVEYLKGELEKGEERCYLLFSVCLVSVLGINIFLS